MSPNNKASTTTTTTMTTTELTAGFHAWKSKRDGSSSNNNNNKSSCKEDDQPNYLKVSVFVVLMCLLSAVVHEHKDKRRYDAKRDFPYARLPSCDTKFCHGNNCLREGKQIEDPVWNNFTSSVEYVVGRHSGIQMLKEPVWSQDSRKPVFLSMLVLSAPKNFDERLFVRKNFLPLKTKLEAEFKRRVVLTFLLGNVRDSELAQQLDQEHKVYGDILQISMMDGYRSLAYKTMSSFLWHNRISAPVDWIVKFDDDVDVSWDKLLPNFQREIQNSTEAEEPKLFCHLILRDRPTFRAGKSLDPYQKMLIDEDSYASEGSQPPYCNGWVYILSPETGRQIALASQVTPFVHVEDFFVTGILRERLGFGLVSIGNDIPFFDDGRLHCSLWSIWRAEYLESFATPRGEWPFVTLQRTFDFVGTFFKFILCLQ